MIITFGEILLRLSTPEAGKISQVNGFNAAYGGAEANVAVSLSLLGNEVAHVTRFPENNLSHAAIMSLKKFGINTGKIIWGGSRLGLYYLETGQGLRGSKVIYDRAGSAMAEIKPGMVNWKKAFEGVTWFHFSGITPAISQSAADTCLEALQVAEEQGITVSIDLNFREKLWKYGKRPNEILPELLDYCDIIFGGIDAPEKYSE